MDVSQAVNLTQDLRRAIGGAIRGSDASVDAIRSMSTLATLQRLVQRTNQRIIWMGCCLVILVVLCVVVVLGLYHVNSTVARNMVTILSRLGNGTAAVVDDGLE